MEIRVEVPVEDAIRTLWTGEAASVRLELEHIDAVRDALKGETFTVECRIVGNITLMGSGSDVFTFNDAHDLREQVLNHIENGLDDLRAEERGVFAFGNLDLEINEDVFPVKALEAKPIMDGSWEYPWSERAYAFKGEYYWLGEHRHKRSGAHIEANILVARKAIA